MQQLSPWNRSSFIAKMSVFFVMQDLKQKSASLAEEMGKCCDLCHSFYLLPRSAQVTLVPGRAGSGCLATPTAATHRLSLQNSKHFLSVYMSPLAGRCVLSAAHLVLPKRALRDLQFFHNNTIKYRVYKKYEIIWSLQVPLQLYHL